MLTSPMRRLYRRLLALGFLCACLAAFSSSSIPETVLAARCLQDCEPYASMCYDACPDDCSDTDAACDSCMNSCTLQLQNCMRGAVYCSTGSVNYNPRCQNYYADHCPWNSTLGAYDCTSPSAHSGNFQICETIGGQQCVACAGGESCVGSNGLPPC
jgi:hypothetical protein